MTQREIRFTFKPEEFSALLQYAEDRLDELAAQPLPSYADIVLEDALRNMRDGLRAKNPVAAGITGP